MSTSGASSLSAAWRCTCRLCYYMTPTGEKNIIIYPDRGQNEEKPGRLSRSQGASKSRPQLKWLVLVTGPSRNRHFCFFPLVLFRFWATVPRPIRSVFLRWLLATGSIAVAINEESAHLSCDSWGKCLYREAPSNKHFAS